MKDLHAQFDAKGKSMTNRPIRKKGKEREREREKERKHVVAYLEPWTRVIISNHHISVPPFDAAFVAVLPSRELGYPSQPLPPQVS